MSKESVGAIWRKQTQKGELLSIQLEIEGKKYKLVAWPNTFKKEDKQPDYKLYVDDFKPTKPALAVLRDDDKGYDKPSPKLPDYGDDLPF